MSGQPYKCPFFNMAFLQYAGNAYIVDESDNIVLSLGAWYTKFMTYTSVMPSGNITNISEFQSYFDDVGFIGGSTIYKTSLYNAFNTIQIACPTCIGHEMDDTEWTSSRYLKIVFSDGRYLKSMISLSASGDAKFKSYDAEGNVTGSNVLCGTPTNFGSNTHNSYFQIVVSNISGDEFPSSGEMYAYEATASPNFVGRNRVHQTLNEKNATYKFFHDLEPFTPAPPDPFAPGGNSEPGGGTGDFDGTSDPVDFPNLPTLSAADAGFITLFNPSITQLKALATYMWSNSLFDLNTWKKIFADPMDAILGLTVVPINVPSGGTGVVTVGNIPTDINMTYAATQYVEVDCGSLNVNEYWGAYLDYSPFTKAEIYLPYIGTHALNTDDIMNKTIHVKYHIDILSGACAAYVKCGDSVLYTFIGQCASSIPITGSDMTNVINGVLSAAASIGSMIATGGATAPLAVPALANTAVNSMKPDVEKSGSMSGTGGMLGLQTPYLILTRPRQCVPESQSAFMGYPSFISSEIGSLSGYTEVEQVHLDGVPATDMEISEIESLLKSGVIL